MLRQCHVAVNIRFIIQSNLLRTAKGQSKKSASKLLSSPDDITIKKKRNIKGHLSLCFVVVNI